MQLHQPAQASLQSTESLQVPGAPAKLVMDAANTPTSPKNFRTDPGLMMSGSGVFSAAAMPGMASRLPATQVVDVDLRQETHLFVNGAPVSWYGYKDDANLGLSHDQVLAAQAHSQRQLQQEKAITFDYIPKKSVKLVDPVRDPKTVQTEEQVATAAGWGYLRLTVPDHHRPQDSEVDRFTSFVRGLPPQTWLHFHCRGGVGRTTTFMAMYDMMHNARSKSFDAILQHQTQIGGKDLSTEAHSSDPIAQERHTFLRSFYDYAKANTDNFRTSYSTWRTAADQQRQDDQQRADEQR